MKREAVKGRAREVLELLEEAVRTRKARKLGPFVSTWELVEKIGINFKAGMIVLQHRKDPARGLGFEIERKPDSNDTNGGWKFRLVAYPANWEGASVNLTFSLEESVPAKKPGPKPKQLALFGASR